MNLKKLRAKINSDIRFNNYSSEMQISQRAEAVRQSNAIIALEGFVLDPKVIELNRRFVSGEISLQDKLFLIKDLYTDT